VDAAEEKDISQTIDEQGHPRRLHHDQLVELGAAMNEVLRILDTIQ
jgi:hypothetical protein